MVPAICHLTLTILFSFMSGILFYLSLKSETIGYRDTTDSAISQCSIVCIGNFSFNVNKLKIISTVDFICVYFDAFLLSQSNELVHLNLSSFVHPDCWERCNKHKDTNQELHKWVTFGRA